MECGQHLREKRIGVFGKRAARKGRITQDEIAQIGRGGENCAEKGACLRIEHPIGAAVSKIVERAGGGGFI